MRANAVGHAIPSCLVRQTRLTAPEKKTPHMRHDSASGRPSTYILILCLLLTNLRALFADPWADNVLNYVPGSGIQNDFVTGEPFSDASAALGEPTRFTSDPENFGGAVTPFQSAFRATEVVTIGEGGQLLVSFDDPVLDDPNNPFGIDLLIFGNSFLSFVDGSPVTEGGIVEVSQDGIRFVTVTGVEADGVYPTLGYSDLAEAFPTLAGSVTSDFLKPVDPAFDVNGKSMSEILVGYNGSGGGAGVDLSSTGLTQISFVRITNPTGSGKDPEIDALADVTSVPEPSSLPLTGLALGIWYSRRSAGARPGSRSSK